MDETCHTYGWVMLHIWMSHVTHMDETCHTYGCVTSHIWMSHVTHIDESYHTHGWVMSRIWMSHGILMDTWVKRLTSHGIHVIAVIACTWMSYSHEYRRVSQYGHGNFLKNQFATKCTIFNEITANFWECVQSWTVKRMIYEWIVWHDSSHPHVSWLIHIYDKPTHVRMIYRHTYEWYTHLRIIHEWIVWHDSIYNSYVCRLVIHVDELWVMSHIWMSYDTYVDESCHTYVWVMSHIWMSHVTHSYFIWMNRVTRMWTSHITGELRVYIGVEVRLHTHSC